MSTPFNRLVPAMAALAVMGTGIAAAAGPEPLPTVDAATAPQAEVPARAHRYLFHVTLHTAAEIDSMLSRAESLAKRIDVSNSKSGIALVLYGPEIRIFDKRNYARYRHIVDKARRLSARHIIDIKLCRTKMKELNLRDQDVPSWVEIVPYGPAEEQRLRGLGYVYL